MLSVFPKLLDYSLFAPLLIRLTLAAVFYFLSKEKITPEKYAKAIRVAFLAASLLLLLGLFTQVIALVMGMYLAYLVYHKIKSGAFLTNGVNYYLILLVLCLILLISGAGRYAIDLPL